MSKRSEKEAERLDAIDRIKAAVKPGDTIYTVLEHVSASGMTRHIRVIVPVVHDDGRKGIWDMTYLVSKALDFGRSKTGALIVGGAGMDMGFHVVYSLSHVMFPNGFICIGEEHEGTRCPSNDHFNGDRDYSPHQHSDGGYALKHSWL